MALIDDVEQLIRKKPGLTEAQIAEDLFTNSYQQRVNSTCRRLLRESRVKRDGRGGRADPFTYSI